MNPEDMKNIMAKAGVTGQPQIQQVPKEVQMMMNLERGLVELSQGFQVLAQNTDITHLKLGMVLGILVDKGIIDEEEIKERYQIHVVDKIKAAQEAADVEVKQRLAEAKQEAQAEPEPEENVVEPTAETEQEPEVESDVVLPSEREDSKIVFKK